MRLVVGFLTSIFVSLSGVLAQPDLGLEYGSYAVGFRSYHFVDDSRDVCPDEVEACEVSGRPLRVFLWYPAVEDTGAPMKLGDLAEIGGSPTEYVEFNDFQNNRIIRAFSGQFFFEQVEEEKTKKAEALRATKMKSSKAGEDAEGKFPLLIHAVGSGSHQMEFTFLWEYLASHGYIVAVPGQFGEDITSTGVRFDNGSVQGVAEDLLFVESQLLEKGIAIDKNKIGYMGHSWGSVPAVSASLQHKQHPPVVMLDGSVNNQRGAAFIKESPIFDGDGRDLNMLNLMTTRRDDLDSSGLERFDQASIRSWRVHDGSHFDFQNWGILMNIFGDTGSPALGKRSVERGAAIGLSAIRLTKDFFDLTLRGDEKALENIERGYDLKSGDTVYVEQLPAN